MVVDRRALLAGATTLSRAGARAATPTLAMVQINQQALFFNQMLQGAQGAAKKAGQGAIAAVESQGRQGDVKAFGWDLTVQAIRGIDAGTVIAVVQQDKANIDPCRSMFK